MMKTNSIKTIAEIANAHEGDLEEAIALFRSSKVSGAYAIKFQIYSADELMVSSHKRYDHFKRQSFTKKEWSKLFNLIDRKNVEVYADVFGLDSLRIATLNKVDGIKIHSSDLGNHHMLSAIKNFSGKVFVSAGGSTAPEIVKFVNPIIKAGNAKEIILMHGFQTYPTPHEDSNLNKINFFKEIFRDNVSYGYMDHTDADLELSSWIPFSLIFSGIDYIEKHITHDRSKKGTDYFSSYEPDEFSKFVSSIQQIEASFGSDEKFFSNSELAYRKQAKKVYVWSKNLKSGSIILENDIVMKRAETSIPSLNYEEIIGKNLIEDVNKEQQITKKNLAQTVLAIVVVRTSSSRLPGKALKKIAGEETIIHLLKRLELSRSRGFIDELVVCTTISETDNELAKLVSELGYKLYRGPEENVLSRMMIAIDDNPQHEIILRITGDDILIDPDYLMETVNNFKINNSDYTDAKNLPSGTEVEVFSKNVLSFINDNFVDTSGSEYLTNYYKEIEEHFRSSSLKVSENYSKLRLTLDNEKDFQVISNLLEYFDKVGKKYNYNLNDINNYFLSNPHVLKINSKVKQKNIPSRFNTKVDWKSYTNDPLITVYITCHNYEDYVEKAIQSVLNQNLSDYELIIIDDGSSDSSREKISKFRSHPKVKIIFQENLGLNRTNNVAINISKGKFIMRLDADDFLDKNALHLMSKKLLDDEELALVFPDYFMIDSHGEILSQEKRHDFDEVKMKDQPAHGACTMFRKSILEKVNNYSEEYDCQDGYEIWTKIAENHKVSNINLPLFYYRQHQKNLTKNEERILSTRSRILSSKSGISKKKNILAIVPIRRENLCLALTPFNETTLLDLTMQKLQNSKRIQKILVSSNDERIKIHCQKRNYRFHFRSDILSEINSPIEDTINNILLEEKDISKNIDFISLINYEYPFLDIRNIENSIDILQVYNANSSMSVVASESNYFNHDGNGLVPLNRNKSLRLERERLYEETGGIHSVNLSWYKKNKSLHSKKVSHLIIDEKASRKIKNLEDLKMFETLFGKTE